MPCARCPVADAADARRRAEEDLLHVIEWLESGHWMACQPLFADDGAKAREKGQRLRALLAAEKAREEAERERDEARICIQIVRDRIERILAAWMRPPGGQEAGVPDKSISPQTCRELLRSLTAEQGSYTYEEWCRTTEAKAAAESRAARLAEKIRRIESACGLPDPAEACRVILAIAAEEGK